MFFLVAFLSKSDSQITNITSIVAEKNSHHKTMLLAVIVAYVNSQHLDQKSGQMTLFINIVM